MALTTELSQVNISGVAPQIRPVEDKSLASAIDIGNDFVDLKQAGLEQGLREGLTDLREEITAPKRLLDSAQGLVSNLQKGLENAGRANKEGLMGERMYKAQAEGLIKKYIQIAPGLTQEFSAVGRQILGRDPSIDLIRLAFEGRKEKVSTAQKEAEARYDSYYKLAIKNGTVPKERNDFASDSDFEGEWLAQSNEQRKRVIVADSIANNNFDAVSQDANARSSVGILSSDARNQIVKIYNEVESKEELSYENKRVEIRRRIEDLKLQISTNISSTFNKAKNTDKTFGSLFSFIDSEITLLSGEFTASISANRVKELSNTGLHEVLNQNDGLGYKIIELGKAFGADFPEIKSIMYILQKQALRTLNPENISKSIRPLFTDIISKTGEVILTEDGKIKVPKQTQTLGDSVGNLFNIFSKDKEAQDKVKKLIKDNTLIPLIDDYKNNLALYSRDLGKESDSKYIDLVNNQEKAIIEVAANLDLEKMTDEDYKIIQSVLASDTDAIIKFFNEGNKETDKARFSISLSGDKIRVKGSRIRPFGDKSRYNISQIQRHIESTYRVWEKTVGGDKEDFINYINQVEKPKDDIKPKSAIQQKAEDLNPNSKEVIAAKKQIEENGLIKFISNLPPDATAEDIQGFMIEKGLIKK